MHLVINSKCITTWLKFLICTDRFGKKSESGFWGETGEHNLKKKKAENEKSYLPNLMLTSQMYKLGNGRVHAMLSCSHTCEHACVWARTHCTVSLLLPLAQWGGGHIWSLLDPLCYKIHARNTHADTHTPKPSWINKSLFQSHLFVFQLTHCHYLILHCALCYFVFMSSDTKTHTLMNK